MAMMNKRKGYAVERKIRIVFENAGWTVIRSGGSLGESDLVCFKDGKCMFLQIKSTKKEKFYYYGYKSETMAGFPFYLLVDFGYGKIRITKPVDRVELDTGESLAQFLEKSI